MKSIFLINVLIFCAIRLFSQTFGGEIMAGLSASQLDGDNWGGYNKAGLTFGVFTNAPLTKYIDAQLEIRYVQKGSKSKGDDQPVFYLSKLNYVEMPVFLKYSFLKRFSFNIGIAAGYLQKATEDKDGIGDLPADPAFNKFEFSGLAGVEYRFLEQMYFNVRFNYSALPIRSHPGDQSFYLNQGQYNNVLTFTVNYEISSSDGTKRKNDCGCIKRSKRFGLR